LARKSKGKSHDKSLKELEGNLEEKAKEAEEYLTQVKYLQADFDNFKKRVEKEKVDWVKFASGRVVTSLIDVMENMERALDSAKQTENDDLIKGLELIYLQFKEVLEKEGLQPIESIGEVFDPTKHEVMMCEDQEGVEEDCIIEEFQRGYMLHDKVLRHSKVKVCKR
jgi:molecular chaperone GrpE